MAIGVLFEIPGMTQEQYDAIAGRLTQERGLKRRSDWPVEGLVVHAAGPTDGGWRVFDVWESAEAFERFGQHLGPVIAEEGIDVTPAVFPLHNLVAE